MNSRPIVSDLDDREGDEGYLGESPTIEHTDQIRGSLISVVIPLYNEEYSIKNVIDRIPDHNTYEIIVVDDGSTDNSVKKIKEIKDKNIKIIQHDKNQGYGASILTGFKQVTGNIIVTIDSDGQHNPEEISKIIKPIIDNQADIVIGSRYLGKSGYKIPLHTRIGEYFVKFCLWFLYQKKVFNNQSGFRAISKSSLEIFNNMRDTEFGLCTEILFKAASNNLRIIEIPVIVNSRKYGSSSVKLFRMIKSICTCIFFYGMKKLKINKFVPKPTYERIYNFLMR